MNKIDGYYKGIVKQIYREEDLNKVETKIDEFSENNEGFKNEKRDF
jgi:hypothetical protein